MKKLILLLAIVVVSLAQPVFAANITVKCSYLSKPDLSATCKDFTDQAVADKFIVDMTALSATCVASAGSCPAEKPVAAPLKKDAEVVKLENPLTIGSDVKVIIGTIIKGVLGIMGGLVLLMVVYGGGAWITAAGSPEKVKAGSQTILWALLGAIITTASYIILSGIMKYF